MSFEDYLGDLPLLHTWDGGQTWVTGGFQPTHLRDIHRIIGEQFPNGDVSMIETGAGNSTLTFLHLSPTRLVSIAPDEELRERLLKYCIDQNLDRTPLEYMVERSERLLPVLAAAEQRFDVALIDGGHGWPTVFVDFCYLNMMLGRGGLLLVDDLQLYSVAELSRLLAEQEEFELIADLGKLQVWKKTVARRFLPDHSREPYIVANSKKRRLPKRR